MDTSETYIKMCEKAEEIQKGWRPQSGDFVWRRYTVFGEEIDSQVWSEEQRADITILVQKSSVGTYWSAVDAEGNERIFNTAEDLAKCTCIWLPRQDQLQEMVDGSIADSFDKFVWWVEGYYGRGAHEFSVLGVDLPSLEQLWLRFVMGERYNKVWKDGEWVPV